MTYEVALLIFGILLLLLGLVGKIKAKELEVGTNSSLVRVVTAIIGFILIVFSLNPELPRTLLSDFTGEVTKSDQSEQDRVKREKEKAEQDRFKREQEKAEQDRFKKEQEKAEQIQYKNARINVEKIARKWFSSLKYGDVDTFIKLSGEPFFIGNKLVLSKNELRSEYLHEHSKKGDIWYKSKVLAIKVQTVKELKDQGHDLSKYTIIKSLNLTLEDYIITIRIIIMSREDRILLVAKKFGDDYEIVGMQG